MVQGITCEDCRARFTSCALPRLGSRVDGSRELMGPDNDGGENRPGSGGRQQCVMPEMMRSWKHSLDGRFEPYIMISSVGGHFETHGAITMQAQLLGTPE